MNLCCDKLNKKHGGLPSIISVDFILKNNLLDFDGTQIKTIVFNKSQSELSEDILQVIEKINQLRLLLGRKALKIDPKLCDASKDHSKDMETHNFFSHRSHIPGKASFLKRAQNFGTTAGGENIAIAPNFERAFTGWYESPGHHLNMLNKNFTHVGLGKQGQYWTLMLR